MATSSAILVDSNIIIIGAVLVGAFAIVAGVVAAAIMSFNKD
jgi:hypothetical protein